MSAFKGEGFITLYNHNTKCSQIIHTNAKLHHHNIIMQFTFITTTGIIVSLLVATYTVIYILRCQKLVQCYRKINPHSKKG